MRHGVVLQGLALPGVGLFVGASVSLWGAPLLESLLFEVEARDPSVVGAPDGFPGAI